MPNGAPADSTHHGELLAAAELALRDGRPDVAAYLLGTVTIPQRLGQLGRTNEFGEQVWTDDDPELTHPDYAARRERLQSALDASYAATTAAWKIYNDLAISRDATGAGAIETAAIFYYSLATGAVPESVALAWRGSLTQAAAQTLPLLERTIDRAAADPAYGAKWIETANALRSQVEGILTASQQNATLDALVAAIEAADRRLKQGLDWVANLVNTGRQIVTSPWAWGLALGALALIYVPGLAGGAARAGREAYLETTGRRDPEAA